MKPVMIHLTEGQLTRLQQEKDITGCSISSQIRTALIEFWKKHQSRHALIKCLHSTSFVIKFDRKTTVKKSVECVFG